MELNLQEKNNYCVCSIFQAALKKHGIKIEQSEISKRLSPSEKGFYVDDKRVINFFESFGLKYSYFFHNQTPFNEPDELLKEMVDGKGFIGFDNHTYLVYNFQDPIVKVIDPKDGKRKEMNLEKLRKLMQEKGDGFFGLIKKIKE